MVLLRAHWPSSAPKARGGRVSAPTRVGPAWAAREGRTCRTRISHSRVFFRSLSPPGCKGENAPWPRHLKHPSLEFLDWAGQGWGRGDRLSHSLLWECFLDFWWGGEVPTGCEKGAGRGDKKPYSLLPLFSPSFSACRTPPPPNLARGKRTQLSWQLPTLPYFLNQWEREQEEGGGAGLRSGVVKKRWLPIPFPHNFVFCVPLSCSSGFTFSHRMPPAKCMKNKLSSPHSQPRPFPGFLSIGLYPK